MADVADRLRALADAATYGPWEPADGVLASVNARQELHALAPDLARGYADALDALAKVNEQLDDAIKAAVNSDWSQDDYDGWNAARTHAEALLAEAGRLLGDNT